LQRALISGTDPDPELMAQAISLLERALELSPGLAEPYFSLGVAYIAQDNKEKAIESFQNFLEKDSGNDPRASQEAQRYLDTLNAN
jgi:cytochrome c-type biogenesis protein CcmH/NrfG